MPSNESYFEEKISPIKLDDTKTHLTAKLNKERSPDLLYKEDLIENQPIGVRKLSKRMVSNIMEADQENEQENGIDTVPANGTDTNQVASMFANDQNN